MDLLVFGYNGHGQLSTEMPQARIQAERNNITSPCKAFSSGAVDIIWTSWCDSLVAVTDANTGDAQTTLKYFGRGLTRPQIDYITSLEKPFLSKFFGGQFAAGLRGALETREGKQNVTIFGSPETHASPESEVETCTVSGTCRIQHVVVLSNDSLTVTVTIPLSSSTDIRGGETEEGDEYIVHFANLTEFKCWLQQDTPNVPLDSASRRYPRFNQVIGNATTLTALDINGKVWTWAHDARYPKTLGRHTDAENPSNVPCQVPYLSETKIIKIASGGYMTAAISSDGELYLWGQGCPSADENVRQLSVFKECDAPGTSKYPNVTEDGLFIPDAGSDMFLPPPPMIYQPWSAQNAQRWAREVAMMRDEGRLPRHPQDPRPVIGEDQDEFVKCVPVRVNDIQGSAIDVAVGHGHVLVSAEARVPGLPAQFIMRSVLGMGQGEKGQLGVSAEFNSQSQQPSSESPKFVKELKEVHTLTPANLKERKVKEVRCAGWSSWVVVEAQRV